MEGCVGRTSSCDGRAKGCGRSLLHSLRAGDEAVIVAVADAVDLLVEAVLRGAELGRHSRLLAVPVPARHRPTWQPQYILSLLVLSNDKFHHTYKIQDQFRCKIVTGPAHHNTAVTSTATTVPSSQTRIRIRRDCRYFSRNRAAEHAPPAAPIVSHPCDSSFSRAVSRMFECMSNGMKLFRQN